MAGESTVPVVAPDGTPGTVPASEAKAIVDAGGHLMSPREASTTQRRIELEEKYGGVEGAVAPALAGAARGLTLGGSDMALSELGPGMRRRLLDYQDYDPKGSMIGEVGGIAAGALFGDEAGLGRLPGLVTKAGGAVERGVAEGLGGGRIARGAGKLAAGATEGAIYETGKAAGDAAIHDDALTAEKALAAVGHGALFGAGAHALFAGAGAGLGKLVDGASALRAPSVGRLAEAESGSLRGRLGEALEKGADVKTIKALGGSAGDITAIERNVQGGYRRVASDIRGDIEASTGKSIGRHTRESLHEYATARVDELGDKLGGMLKKLDESGAGIAPDVKTFAQKVRAELVEPNVGFHDPSPEAVAKWQAGKGPLPQPERFIKPGQSDVVHAAEKWLGEVEGAFGKKPPTFTEWQKARVALDKQVNFASRNASPEMGALKKIRSFMEKELETSGESAAKSVGGTFADEYQATKSLYQSVRKAAELTERGVGKELANNSIGLRAAIGALSGVATGNPLAGIAMGVAGKVVQDRGDMLAADLLHRAANVMGVQHLASRTDAAIAKGVAKLVGTKANSAGVATLAVPPIRNVAAPLGVALTGNQRKDFDAIGKVATEAASNPSRMVDTVAKALGPAATKSPKLAAAVTQLMMGDAAYLHSKMPPDRRDPYSLQPQLQKSTRASDSEISAFMRTASTIANPTLALHEALGGTLTRDHIEALKERRPLIYRQIQNGVMEALSRSDEPIPYARRIQLGILLDIPTDKTLSPDFQTAIQATYSSAESAGAESPPPNPSRALQLASSLQTPMQSAMSEGLEK